MSWRQIPTRLGLLLLVGAVLVACEGAPSQGPPREALVAQVGDGDTLLLSGGQQVRLLGIDAPELEKRGYDRLRYDRYGRLLAYVFLPDGVMVNAELVRRGLARVYLHPPNTRYRKVLVQAQRRALEARRGIWQQALKQDEPYYVANKRSLRFHRPDCPLGRQMAPANRLIFRSLKKAYLEGYSPCRSCKP
ncbi:MAG: thermonuclease family protein [Deltaproteobacteria bacterium]|nr:thermonuclease family protein [Deltaproteobacteria bacterium]